MKDRVVSLIKKYAITTAIAGVMTLLTIYLHDFESVESLSEKYRILADAFTIPGVVLIMLGCLVAISTTGFFDILSYGLASLGRALVPFYDKKDEKFYDYKTRKNSERFSGYAFIFVVGIAFTIVSLVFTALFYTV